MNDTILDWIQQWFLNNCDGAWEQGEAIQINTTDNPGWEVEIDMSNTSLATLSIPQILNEKNKNDWYSVKIEDKTFSASGDAQKLQFLLGLFKETIEKIEGIEP